jgi:hypothetical protein
MLAVVVFKVLKNNAVDVSWLNRLGAQPLDMPKFMLTEFTQNLAVFSSI